MRLRSHLAFVLLPLGLATICACFVACYQAGDDFLEASSGGSGGEFVPQPPPPPPPAPPDSVDAGADADATTAACADLDQTKPTVLYLSADDSNSMASPVHVRELLHLGAEPSLNDVRTYEFLNYYHVAYPAPPLGELAIFPELDTTPNTGEFDFQIAVRSFDAVKPRRPMTITFVLDTSGSMGGAGIERERAAVLAIAKTLAPGDIVNAVTWNSSNNIVMNGHQVTGSNDPAIVAMANGLEAGGGTDLHAGLVAGYQLAEAKYGLDRLNRVLLISDGGANIGVTDADLIGLKSQDADKEGIYMVGVGTGPALGYFDQLMDTVTDKGRGAYIYLDEPAEADKIFVNRFDEAMEIAARGVQVELTLPWYFQMHKFYGEEYSTDPKEVEPQHLAPSDAMIFNQVLRACEVSQIIQTDTIKVRATWKTPITYALQTTEVSMTVADLLNAQKTGLTKAKAIIAYAEALKAPTSMSLQDAYAQVMAANAGGADPELTEIAELLKIHPKY